MKLDSMTGNDDAVKKASYDPFLKLMSLAYHQPILEYDGVWILNLLNISPAQNCENKFLIGHFLHASEYLSFTFIQQDVTQNFYGSKTQCTNSSIHLHHLEISSVAS